MISLCNHLATEKSKSGSIMIGLKTKTGAAFCSTCINATQMNLIASKSADKALISNGFTNWQDPGTKSRD